MILRKILQTLSLSLFVYLLWQTVFPLEPWKTAFIPTDIFLRLDPLVVTLQPLLSKNWLLPFTSMLLGFCVLILTLFFGRLFCGYVCPMGTTLDLSRTLSPDIRWKHTTLSSKTKHIKYLFLTALLAAAFLGVNHIFWGSPIALITRFYSLLLHPFFLLLTDMGLQIVRPILEMQDSTLFAYTQIPLRGFNSIYFITGFFLLLFALERLRSRFWCRYLCPAGAVLALFSWNPLWRRRVHTCTHCGACAKKCPTGAIQASGESSATTECIACQNCVHACPVGGVRFSFKARKASQKHTLPPSIPSNPKSTPSDKLSPALPSRRAFLYATATGCAGAALAHMNAASFIPSTAKASLAQLGLIRPPGALPETDFLARCIRCGQCMKACPTNGLQPTWFNAGLEGVFSPALQSRLGPCEPECNICGQVCPTQAILPLPLENKRVAKIGTAVVYPELCLAWAEGRSCVVCQEVCAYGAVQVKPHANSPVPVPVITQNKCYGCGFCEHHCPVHIPAIAVQPLNALRLEHNTYTETAQAAGLDLVPVSLRPHVVVPAQTIPKGQLPPGFTN